MATGKRVHGLLKLFARTINIRNRKVYWVYGTVEGKSGIAFRIEAR